ncbi:UNVERIFIED_CONTAM: hypothetical protein GTU68_007259 [Idotea baltica]|nr:hypothetical protein [Idotea baltica]
MIILKPLWLV